MVILIFNTFGRGGGGGGGFQGLYLHLFLIHTSVWSQNAAINLYTSQFGFLI